MIFESDIAIPREWEERACEADRRLPSLAMTGWLAPEVFRAELPRIKAEAERLKSLADVVVCIGIGGSYLGTRALYEALDGTGLLFAGQNLSARHMQKLLTALAGKDFAVVVISKSGTTLEPAIAFRILRAELEKKYGRSGAAERIVAITDARRGALKTLSDREGYATFSVPDDVGGRFSVLTPVGLFPLAVAGIDVDALLDGAAEASQNPDVALKYAAIRNILYHQGKKIELLSAYEPSLSMLCEWWKQLFGESEGKNHRGIFPASTTFTTDLHSLGQYIQEGERTLFETVLSVENKLSTFNFQLSTDPDDTDGLNYLCHKSLSEINALAERGVTIAHRVGGVPVSRIALPQLDAHALGGLIYFFERACAVSALMLGIDPFDQPGVEAYKQELQQLLH